MSSVTAEPAGRAGPPGGTPAGQRTTSRTRSDVRRRIGEKAWTPYLFIAPHFLLFAAFILFPFFFGVYISVFDYFGGRAGPFVGLRWYQQLFDPESLQFPRFWNSVWNTILFVVMSTPLQVGVALGLASLLNQKLRGRNVFRGIYFVPWTLSVAVVGLTWWWMFNGNAGFVTLFMSDTFGWSPNWLATNPWAWITILVATLWWTIGFNTIILLAGMQAISADLYEAASIDGANKWQQFRAITLPSLRPILLLVVTLQIIASLRDRPVPDSLAAFDRILVGTDDVIWLRDGRYSVADSTWAYTAIRNDGTILGRLTGSNNDRIVGFGAGTVLLREEDADGFVTLRVHRLNGMR